MRSSDPDELQNLIANPNAPCAAAAARRRASRASGRPPCRRTTGQARRETGSSKKGVIVAEDVEAAMATLRAQAIMPTTVKPKPKDLAEIFPFLQQERRRPRTSSSSPGSSRR